MDFTSICNVGCVEMLQYNDSVMSVFIIIYVLYTSTFYFYVSFDSNVGILDHEVKKD
jgi:hypothetical protein